MAGVLAGRMRLLANSTRHRAWTGVRVPNGFAVTAQAYRDALSSAKAWESLHSLLDDLDPETVELLKKRAAKARAQSSIRQLTRNGCDSRSLWLYRAGEPMRTGASGCGSQFGDGRRSADGKFRRPTRELPQCSWRRRPVRGLSTVLRLDFH